MQKADYLLRLMKQRTDALVATDEKLQQFLMWVNEKSLSVEVPYKPAAVRIFYFALAFAFDRTLDRGFVPALAHHLDLALDLDLERDLFSALDLDLNRAIELALDAAVVRDIDTALDLALEPELRQALQELKEQLPNKNSDRETSKQWWQANSQAWREQLRQAWREQLRAVMIEHRNIGHNWQFSKEQRELLRQYYDANKLLVDCLNTSCEVTPAVRSQIEETLLLPTKMLPNAEG
jgi:predicted NACHT family NTPase